MTKVVECVPNFSEGRDKGKIEEISSVIKGVSGVELLDVDMGASTNRTVVTFAGHPDNVIEAAFQAIKKAQQIIDMTKHTGAHARMGATDVCPFIPVANMTMDECVELAKKLGKRVADELGIPIYLYEFAASSEERKNLAVVRKGEYEALATKLPTLKPDFGPCELNESVKKSGATVIGARKFLIAYNINLNTKDTRIANEIAGLIRESGAPKKDPVTNLSVKGENGKVIMVPGKMKAVKGVGWFVEEYGIAQLSMNLVDYEINSMHQVFDEVEKLSLERGVRVTGSEIVGVIPLEPIVMAGKHYLKKQKKCTAAPVEDLIHIAKISLGLSEVQLFKPEDKIIEFRLNKGKGQKLAAQPLNVFVDNLSSESPAPGGGSVAALCGSLASALVSMVGNLTVGKKGLENNWDDCNNIAEKAQKLKEWFLLQIDADTDAFNLFMEALKTPRSNPERPQKLLSAQKAAAMVPFGVLEKSNEVYSLAKEVMEKGNPMALSDAGCAGLCANTCAWCAYYNVLINLNGMKQPKEWIEEMREKANSLIKESDIKAQEVKELTMKKLAQ